MRRPRCIVSSPFEAELVLSTGEVGLKHLIMNVFRIESYAFLTLASLIRFVTRSSFQWRDGSFPYRVAFSGVVAGSAPRSCVSDFNQDQFWSTSSLFISLWGRFDLDNPTVQPADLTGGERLPVLDLVYVDSLDSIIAATARKVSAYRGGATHVLYAAGWFFLSWKFLRTIIENCGLCDELNLTFLHGFMRALWVLSYCGTSTFPRRF